MIKIIINYNNDELMNTFDCLESTQNPKYKNNEEIIQIMKK